MKKILFLLLISFSAFSQKIIYNRIDEFSKNQEVKIKFICDSINNELDSENIIQSKEDYYEKAFLDINFIKSKKTNIKKYYLNLHFYLTQIGCLSQYNGKITILTDNKTKIDLKQISNTDCDSAPNANYLISLNQIKQLTLEKIYKIRIYSTDGYQDISIGENKKKCLMNLFKQILKY